MTKDHVGALFTVVHTGFRLQQTVWRHIFVHTGDFSKENVLPTYRPVQMASYRDVQLSNKMTNAGDVLTFTYVKTINSLFSLLVADFWKVAHVVVLLKNIW